MSNSYFRFKQFVINQDKCAMKVGTDGVLLGAWCNVDECRNILDIGTGTGLIALMTAQRSGAMVHAVEIDPEAYLQAKENIRLSPFHDKVNVHNMDFKQYNPGNIRFDLILSNPPYFSDSLRSENSQRNIARHNDSLTIEDLLEKSFTILTPSGCIALILPVELKDRLERFLGNTGFYISRLTNVLPTPSSPPKRILVEITSETNKSFTENTLTIELARHQYSKEYINLTSAFYLKM